MPINILKTGPKNRDYVISCITNIIPIYMYMQAAYDTYANIDFIPDTYTMASLLVYSTTFVQVCPS